MIVLRKIVPKESYPPQQFPRMNAHWMIAHKDSCPGGNLSHPRTITSEKNCFPPVQSLPKKITFEKKSRTIATMDAYFRTILPEENSLEGNCPQQLVICDSRGNFDILNFEIWKFKFHLKVF